MTARTAVALGLVVLLGCHSHRPVAEGRPRCTDEVVLAPRPSLGQDPASIAVTHELHYAFGRSGAVLTRAVRLELERAPIEADFVAIDVLGDGRAIAIGDRGTILVRCADGWRAEPTPTTARLSDLAALDAPLPGLAHVPFDPRSASTLVVGSGGTAVVRTAAGAWSQEATGTNADLHALLRLSQRTLAAGDRGTLLERSQEGTWRAIPTGTSANLIALGTCHGHVCALAKEGVIVDCTASRADPVVCVPRTFPQAAGAERFDRDGSIEGPTLRLVIDTKSRDDVHAPPPSWSPALGAAPFHVHARGHLSLEKLQFVDLSSDGLILQANPNVFRDPEIAVPLPYGARLRAGVLRDADGWFVGDGGLLVHLSLLDARISGWCEL